VAEAIEALAAAAKTPPAEYGKALESGGQGKALAGDILRRKAADRLAELAIPVDEDGNVIELPEIEVPVSVASDEAAEDGDEAGTAEA